MIEIELKKAYCQGAKIDYEIFNSTKEGKEFLDNWYKNFKK